MSSNPPPRTTLKVSAILGSVGPTLGPSIIVNKSLGGIMGQINAIKLYDFAYQPEHPEAWIGVLSRDLEEADLFVVQNWLRLMVRSAYDTITHYTPAMRILAYFERPQDAAMFKLVWGGE